MKPLPFHALLLALPAVPVIVASAPAPAAVVALQDDEVPDKRDDIKELLDTFSDHVKARGEEDREAIAIIDQLVQEYGNLGPKDRASVVKEVSDSLKAKRKDNDDGTADNRLFRAAAVSLGEMGPESAKALSSWIGDKRHRKDLTLQTDLVKSLGKTRDEKGIKTLVGLLDHHEAALQAASAEALANYSEFDLKTRKDIFEAVLKVLTAIKGRTDSDINDIIARERYDTISASMITTLQVLSGHNERRPEEWQRWWNKNKKKNWDEGA